jgi:hypothetical protein
MSLSGRGPTFNKRRERTIASRSRRIPVTHHGRSKRWLERESLMRLHVCAQQRVHSGLISRALFLEPFNDIGVDPK